MDNSIKNINQTSNLIDTTQDITNRNTDDYLVSSERNNITNSNSKKQKKVKFSQNVEYIDVECWKQYNYENTVDENFEVNQEDEEDNDKLKNNNNKTNNDNEKNKKKDNIVCTCILI